MKKTRFSEEQMVKILCEADKTPVSEAPKKHGVSDVTIYAWRKRFGRLEAVAVKRLRQLEHENGRLKRRRTTSAAAARDAPAVAVMQELAAQYPRYGYRRIQVFLARLSHQMNPDQAHRLWRLDGL